jgi:phosphatidylglycerophosphate synthase
MERYSDPDRPANYAYKSVNNSLINAFYNRYWLPWAVKAIPERMPANLVSILGDVGVWAAFLVLSGLAAGPLGLVGRDKPWLFGICAFCLFFYHTMDNLDGIQARRTGSSGPLGEFVDHWFDSFNTFLIPLGVGLAFPVIPPLLVAVTILLCCVADWLSLRTTRNSGVLVFGKVSSEEALLFSYLFCLAVWAMGYDFWTKTMVLGVPLVVLVYSISPIVFLASIVMTFKSAGRPDLLAIMFSCILPLFAWTILAEQRLGSMALLAGCLLMGFSAARFSGDVMRDRLVGLEYRGFFPSIVAMGLLLLGTEFIPGLPIWASSAAIAISFIWIFFALGGQFYRTVVRVRETTGVGLFGPATAPLAEKGVEGGDA